MVVSKQPDSLFFFSPFSNRANHSTSLVEIIWSLLYIYIRSLFRKKKKKIHLFLLHCCPHYRSVHLESVTGQPLKRKQERKCSTRDGEESAYCKRYIYHVPAKEFTQLVSHTFYNGYHFSADTSDAAGVCKPLHARFDAGEEVSCRTLLGTECFAQYCSLHHASPSLSAIHYIAESDPHPPCVIIGHLLPWFINAPSSPQTSADHRSTFYQSSDRLASPAGGKGSLIYLYGLSFIAGQRMERRRWLFAQGNSLYCQLNL